MTLKLADAIRLGCADKENIESNFFMKEKGVILGCCTLGAAMIGSIGEKRCTSMKNPALQRSLRKSYPCLNSTEAASKLFENLSVDGPELPEEGFDLFDAIAHINDETNLSIVDIAKGLEALDLG
jgi:hypothetical protein